MIHKDRQEQTATDTHNTAREHHQPSYTHTHARIHARTCTRESSQTHSHTRTTPHHTTQLHTTPLLALLLGHCCSIFSIFISDIECGSIEDPIDYYMLISIRDSRMAALDLSLWVDRREQMKMLMFVSSGLIVVGKYPIYASA